MLKDWIVGLVESAAISKAVLPRIGRLAKSFVIFLIASLFFSAIGIVALGYLVYRLAVKPTPSTPSQFDQINTRLDRIEKQLYNP